MVRHPLIFFGGRNSTVVETYFIFVPVAMCANFCRSRGQIASPQGLPNQNCFYFEPTKRTPRGNNNESKMAEAERSGNPFSFKTFVKSKQETKDVKIKKKQDKQHNSRKGEICLDESPFPDVTDNKPVHSQQGKL